MKKLHSRGLALLTAAALSLSALGTAAGAAGEGALPLTVNGAETGITVTEENGGYIVPLRALAESLLSLRTVGEVRYLVDGEYAAVYGSASVLEPYTARN